ncbi:hypothetical protein [Microbacterium arborescens]|uniref:hypothetical protein n=1 Tax=Microbacterium arborescens TaxID=33883 RepID=UPI003C739EFD
MPNSDLLWVFSVTAGLLALVITLLVTYWVLRLAIFHGMRAHTRWVEEGGDAAYH